MSDILTLPIITREMARLVSYRATDSRLTCHYFVFGGSAPSNFKTLSVKMQITLRDLRGSLDDLSNDRMRPAAWELAEELNARGVCRTFQIEPPRGIWYRCVYSGFCLLAVQLLPNEIEFSIGYVEGA